MALQKIRDVDGRILHSGEAATLKEFVQRVADEHGTLARADLSGLDLAYLKAPGVDFTGARLDRTDLRGAVLRRSVFRRASMRGIMLAGAGAERSDLREVDLSPAECGSASCLDGVQMAYARLDGACLDCATAKGAGMSSASMSGVRARRAVFDGCHMHNVDWTGAEIIGCSFRDAFMTPTWKRGIEHVPDRTAEATLAGNDMTGARIGKDCRSFRRDHLKNRVARHSSWLAVTAGLFVATSRLPIDEGSIMDSGMPFIVSGGAILLKARIEDMIGDLAEGWAGDLVMGARRAVAKLVRAGRAVSSVAVAFAASRHADVLAAAMKRRGGGLFERLKAAAGGNLEVLVCDRKRLARALAVVSDAAAGLGREADVLLLRPGEEDLWPRAVVLRRDGSTEAIWARTGRLVAKLAWNRDGVLQGEVPSGGWKGMSPSLGEVLETFSSATLRNLGEDRLRVDYATHKVRVGVTGAAVVQRRADQRLDNPHGPSVLAPDGTALAGRIRRMRKDRAAEEPNLAAAP